MATSEPRTVPRWRKWAGRLLLGLIALMALLVVLTVGTVNYLLSSLDQPDLKARLQREVKAASGLEVDWSRLAIAPLGGGLSVDDLVVLSPKPLRTTAAEFLVIKHLGASWDPRRLARGERPFLDSVTIDSIDVSLVDDVQQGTSLALLFPTDPHAPPPKPGPGLSHTLSTLFVGEPFVSRVFVKSVRASWQKVDGGKVVDHATVSGLTLLLHGWKAELTGDAMTVEAKDQRAVLGLIATADSSAKGADLTLRVLVASQTFEPSLKLERLVELEAAATFEPSAHLVHVALNKGQLLDDAAIVAGRVELLDDGAVLVPSLLAKLVLPQLARDAAVFGVPVQLEEGSAELSVKDAQAAPSLTLRKGGAVSLTAEASGLEYRPQAELKHATLTAKLFEQGGQREVSFSSLLQGVSASGATLETLKLEGAASESSKGWKGTADLGVTHLAASGAQVDSLELAAKGARLKYVGGDAPVSGALDLETTLHAVSYATPSLKAALSQLHLALDTELDGHPVYAANVKLDGPLHLTGGDGRVWFDGPLALEAKVHKVAPASESGVVSAKLTAGELALNLEANRTSKGGAHVDATLTAPTLTPVAPFVSLPAGWSVGWKGTSATLTTALDADGLLTGLPHFTHLTTLELKGLEADSPKGKLLAPTLSLSLDAKGTTRTHAGTLALRCGRCVMGKVDLGDEQLAATFDVDRQAPTVHAAIDAKGEGPQVKGTLSLEGRKAEHRLALSANLTLARLSALAPLVAGSGVDVTALEGRVTANGSLDPERPDRTFSGSATADLTGLSWEQDERSVELASLSLTAKVDATEQGQRLQATARSNQVEVALAEKTAKLTGVGMTVEGQLLHDSREATGKLGLTINQVTQDFAPDYPMGGLRLAASGSRDETGLITLARSTLTNEAAGTALWLDGAVAPEPTHAKASLQVQLTQDLARAWRDPKRFEGKGTAVLKVGVHSGDLRAFNLAGSLNLSGADLKAGTTIAQGVQGELPFSVDVVSDDKGVHLVRSARVNPYALLRFQDQHPLIKDQSFLTIKSLTTPMVTIAPLAANVQLSQSVLYVSQLEASVLQGSVTGELVVDMNEQDPKVRANVRATGITSEEGDVFSGNAALALSLNEHSIDGRAEVLQLSRRQLLRLLDLQDPHHTSASSNRIRSVLAIGYPDRLHIVFNHGFANMRVTFGGAASLVQLDELRGIPVESLVDRYVFTKDDEGDGT
jgi:hypothetical protein